jgi:hypothetical protein
VNRNSTIYPENRIGIRVCRSGVELEWTDCCMPNLPFSGTGMRKNRLLQVIIAIGVF